MRSFRTLQRQFHYTTGLSPYEWLVRERVAIAREMLEAQPVLPVARIAELAGFGSVESLRRHFSRIVRTSPTAYRQRFERDVKCPLIR